MSYFCHSITQFVQTHIKIALSLSWNISNYNSFISIHVLFKSPLADQRWWETPVLNVRRNMRQGFAKSLSSCIRIYCCHHFVLQSPLFIIIFIKCCDTSCPNILTGLVFGFCYVEKNIFIELIFRYKGRNQRQSCKIKKKCDTTLVFPVNYLVTLNK